MKNHEVGHRAAELLRFLEESPIFKDASADEKLLIVNAAGLIQQQCINSVVQMEATKQILNGIRNPPPK